MKLGITKEELPIIADRCLRYFGGMIAGAGVGMFVAVAFIPEDDRKIFNIHFFVTAWILISFGTIVASLANLFQPKKIKKERHMA